MNVLSLFDGMSCGQIALNRLGIKYDNYFACEIDKYAIKVTQHNYPNTVQLGDVNKVDFTKLPKIDLLIGGSPCQGFSFAGKQLAFEDPRSRLFFEFVRALKETNPKYFLLENVKMKKEYQNIISKYLGVIPIKINSNLYSAQNRERLYWTNILVNSAIDKKIMLNTILDHKCKSIDYDYIKNNFLKFIAFNKRISGFSFNSEGLRFFRSDKRKSGISEIGRVIVGSTTKTPTLTTSHIPKYIDDGGNINKISPLTCERLQTVPDNYTAIVSDTQRYKMLGNGWTVDVICHILSGIQ